jgi:Tfp pilus assembly protein PilV
MGKAYRAHQVINMRRSDRRGFVLPATIGALVIIGVLVTAGFYIAQQELRIGVASNYANKAVNIAQAGANEVLANWNGYQLGSIAIWSDTTITDTIATGIWEVSVANANNYVYFVTATGTSTEGGARWAGAKRSIGIVTKMIFANIDPPAALTTRGKTIVKGTALVNGTNTTPPSWGPYCGAIATNDTTGVLTNDTSVISLSGAGAIAGNPQYDQDSTIVDSTFTNFGNLDWAQLTALAQADGKDISSWGSVLATPIAPDTTAAGRCDESLLTNWGDTVPTNPCGAYFPLIYHGGPSLSIQNGGYGQGILLVDGDLELRGNFLFYGIIIVQGDFQTQGSGNRIIGAVMASNSTLDQQTVTGGSEITYSRCAVTRSILTNASRSRARPLQERSWVDLTAVAN